MPILKHRGGLYAKGETTYGTAASIVADDFVLTEDLTQSYQTEVIEPRQTKQTIGVRSHVRGRVIGTLNFSTELTASSAAGVAPKWGRLLRACGWSEVIVADTSVTYRPTSSISGADSSVTLRMYYDNTIYVDLLGSRGNVVIDLQAGQRAMLNFTFQGLVDAIKDGPFLTPLPASEPPLVVTQTGFSIGGYNAITNGISIDLQNDIQLTDNVSAVQAKGGYGEVVVVGRNPVGTISPEATTVAANDAWGQFFASTPLALSMSLQGGGRTNKIDVDRAVYREFAMGDRAGVLTNDLPFTCAEGSGDDEIAIIMT